MNVHNKQGDQMIWKKSPNFFKSDPNNPNNGKTQTIFLNSLFWSKCNQLEMSTFLAIS